MASECVLFYVIDLLLAYPYLVKEARLKELRAEMLSSNKLKVIIVVTL